MALRCRRVGAVHSIIRDRVEPAASPAMSAMPPKAEVNSEDLAAPPLRVDVVAVDVIQAPKLEHRITLYELSDNEWTAIKPMLPNTARVVRRVNDRRVLNGIFWVLRSGAPWHDLPETYVPAPLVTCYNRFVRWRRAADDHRRRGRKEPRVWLPSHRRCLRQRRSPCPHLSGRRYVHPPPRTNRDRPPGPPLRPWSASRGASSKPSVGRLSPCTGDARSHDLDVDAIACVLRAWGDFEGDAWAGGFVLEQRDGRRAYVESYADGDDWGPDSCASVVPMATDSDLPKLPSKHASELYGWTENLPELGEYLRRVVDEHSRGDQLTRGVQPC